MVSLIVKKKFICEDFTMQITSILLAIILILNMLLATIVIFIERREPSTTWAWLLVLFFLPVAGFILYLFLGRNLRSKHLFQWEDQNKIGIESALHKQLNELISDDFHFRNNSTRDNRDLIYMHLRTNDALLTEDNNSFHFYRWQKKV